MLPPATTGRARLLVAAAPLLATCVECGDGGNNGPPNGEAAMYGTLVALSAIIALGLLGWELVVRYRRYEKGDRSRLAWTAAFAVFVVGLASTVGAIALIGLIAAVTSSGFETRNSEECFVAILPQFVGVLLALMASARAAFGTVAGLLAPRPWGLPAAVAMLLLVSATGTWVGSMNEGTGVVVMVVSAASGVLLLGLAAGLLVWRGMRRW